MDKIRTVVIAGSSLGSQSWWPALHGTINLSYHDKASSAFPPTWTRVNPDPAIGAERLAQELGANSHMAVFLLDDFPIACGGVYPYPRRWTIEDKDLESITESSGQSQTEPRYVDADRALSADGTFKDWEICCFCVHPDHRHRGLGRRLVEILSDHVRPLGGNRLITNFVIEETGTYWPSIGFETVPGAGGKLSKGWTHTYGKEGLSADIHFAWGIKEI